jgi:hypothetical protein
MDNDEDSNSFRTRFNVTCTTDGNRTFTVEAAEDVTEEQMARAISNQQTEAGYKFSDITLRVVSGAERVREWLSEASDW